MHQKTSTGSPLTTADLENVLREMMPLDGRTGGVVDVLAEDAGHRHGVLKIRPGLYLTVDIEEDIIVSLLRSADADVAQDILENFRGYEVCRLRGFDLGPSIGEGSIIP